MHSHITYAATGVAFTSTFPVDVLMKSQDGAYTVNKEKYAVNSKWNGRLLRYNSTDNVAEGLVTTMYPAEYKGMSLIDDATKVWSFIELATLEKRPVTVNGKTIYINNYLTPEQMTEVKVIFYDKDGETLISAQVILKGSDAELPEALEHEGFEFSHWF